MSKNFKFVELPNNKARNTIETIIDSLFFCDITLNFITGYIDEMNRLIMNQKKIAARYLKSWFCIDVIATVPFELIANMMNIDAG